MTEISSVSIDRTICQRLGRRPLKALRLFQSQIANAASPLVVNRLNDRFGNTMELLVRATKIATEEGLRTLPEAFSLARRSDQKRLLTAVVDHLASLGVVAKMQPDSPAATALQRFGSLVPSLVLEGTLQQQFFCKVATRLGFPRIVPLSRPLIELVAIPMIGALENVIRVGAETTRDSAIEGMGALLKLASRGGAGPMAADRFQPTEPIRDGRGDPKLNAIYEQRLKRRRMMVLAVADPEWAKVLREEAAVPIEEILDRVRSKGSISEVGDEIETVLYRRSDLLRILPAIARQNEDADPAPSVELLCRAAEPLVPRPGDPPAVLIAYARYQESVFRTIDTMMKRSATYRDFDDVVAAAVHTIPQTMAGLPQVCNAQVRATVSIIRTAVRVTHLAGKNSKTRAALRPLFRGLGEKHPWLNLGIAEGCYRGLPELLSQKTHEELYVPALDALIEALASDHAPDDLAAVHRSLIATSCFRRMLISLADRVYERHLDKDVDDGLLDLSNVEEDLLLLLREPTPENVVAIFQRQACAVPAAGGRSDIAASVIAAIAHECDLLRKATPLFQTWKELPSFKRVLLTRILAAQMHGVSRDAVEVSRYPVLSRVFAGMTTVAIPEAEATDQVWQLLASLPSEAAEAADPDIQRFVEYRGKRQRAANAEEPVEDLPGYVLAMISPQASNRIAGAIAREIDLNLRHDRDRNPKADFAEPLYQVMLRGPAESIFDHLMPRLADDGDRTMVELFRKHVSKVVRCRQMERDEVVPYLSKHVTGMLKDLKNTTSPTLLELREALTLFKAMLSDDRFWDSIKGQSLSGFFALLDRLDARTHGGAGATHRGALTPRFGARLVAIEQDIKHYLELPVGKFGARSGALLKAAKGVSAVEEELSVIDTLQPPERVLLIALLNRVRDVLERTNRWYCIEAQRHVAENDKDGFWMVFALDTGRWARVAARLKSHVGTAAERERVQHKEAETSSRLEKLKKMAGEEPPRFAGQTEQFEDFAVEWMSSDLDLEALANALTERWNWPFRRLFDLVTTPWAAFTGTFLPFLFVIATHAVEAHAVEGLGFGVLTLGILIAACGGLLRVVRVMWNKQAAATERQKHRYLFRCHLPQLAGFIAAPMALIAKFDHSYEFPLHASPLSVLLLMLLAFLTTRFFLEREIVDRRPSALELSTRERQKVAKTVGVALVQAFVIAVLLTFIFADSHYRASEPPETRITDAHHKADFHDLVHLLPQEAFLDLELFTPAGYQPWPVVKQHGLLTFYPVTILTWTTLGLFFGLVLEGIGKGEHLRRQAGKETH